VSVSKGSPGERRRRYSFGDFTLDLDRAVICRGTEEVALRKKSFEVLAYLVEHHGRLVTKAELAERVWPDTAVMDNSLAQCIVEIRRALADEAQLVIRTVARRGYLFTAPVSTPVMEFLHQPTGSAAAAGPMPLAYGREAHGMLNPRVLMGGVFALAALFSCCAAAGLADPTREPRTHIHADYQLHGLPPYRPLCHPMAGC
jgi:DNA-binding winged helix-turn-helix (wHTH) protein